MSTSPSRVLHTFQLSIHQGVQTCAFCGLPRDIHPENPPTEMASLREIKQRLAAIEQGQDKLESRIEAVAIGQNVLCERLDEVLKKLDGPFKVEEISATEIQVAIERDKRIEQKLDMALGARLPSEPKAQRRRK